LSREKYILFAFICNFSGIFPENWKYGGIREKTGQKLGDGPAKFLAVPWAFLHTESASVFHRV